MATSDPTRPTTSQAVNVVVTLLRARHGEPVALEGDPSLPVFIQVLKFAGQHGIAAALAQGLRRAATPGMPWAGLQPFLDDLELRNAARNRQFRSSVLALSRRLAADGINCVFLKGAVFLFAKEGPADWRSLSDLDVLVAPDQIETAAAVLRTEGYILGMDPSGYQARYHHHYAPLYDPTTGIMVELHGRLMQNPRENAVTHHEIFRQAQSVVVEGESVRIPCPEHRMIHLIAHAQNSNWGYALRQISFKDLVDAAELDALGEMDWAGVRDAFARVAAEDQLLGFVWAAHMLLGVRLPFPPAEFGTAKAWAMEAALALDQPAAAWRTFLRMAGQYVRMYARHPGRLRLVWNTMAEPARRKSLIRVSTHRLGRPAWR